MDLTLVRKLRSCILNAWPKKEKKYSLNSFCCTRESYSHSWRISNVWQLLFLGGAVVALESGKDGGTD